MKIILDVNVILSALIRDSVTRKILVLSDFDFYFPEPSLHKIRKYQNYVLEKSGLIEEEYFEVIRTLFRYIRIIPKEEIQRNWNEAKEIMYHIDPEDVIFIAAALSLENSIIWSNDKDFDGQTRINILKTSDVVKMTGIE